MTVEIAIAYHSGFGHNAAMARAVRDGVDRAPRSKVRLIDVTDMTDESWDTLANADAIIFGSPTYMGAVSGPFKSFMDKTARIWLERGWRNKLAAGFTVSSSQAGDKFATLSQLMTLACQHGMIWVSLDQLPGNNSSKGSVDDLNRIGGSLGAMAQANNDEGGDIAPPGADRETAALLGLRVAEVTRRFKSGSNGIEAGTLHAANSYLRGAELNDEA